MLREKGVALLRICQLPSVFMGMKKPLISLLIFVLLGPISGCCWVAMLSGTLNPTPLDPGLFLVGLFVFPVVGLCPAFLAWLIYFFFFMRTSLETPSVPKIITRGALSGAAGSALFLAGSALFFLPSLASKRFGVERTIFDIIFTLLLLSAGSLAGVLCAAVAEIVVNRGWSGRSRVKSLVLLIVCVGVSGLVISWLQFVRYEQSKMLLAAPQSHPIVGRWEWTVPRVDRSWHYYPFCEGNESWNESWEVATIVDFRPDGTVNSGDSTRSSKAAETCVYRVASESTFEIDCKVGRIDRLCFQTLRFAIDGDTLTIWFTFKKSPGAAGQKEEGVVEVPESFKRMR